MAIWIIIAVPVVGMVGALILHLNGTFAEDEAMHDAGYPFRGPSREQWRRTHQDVLRRTREGQQAIYKARLQREYEVREARKAARASSPAE